MPSDGIIGAPVFLLTHTLHCQMAKIPKLTRSGMRLTKTMYVLKMSLFGHAIVFFHQNPSLVFFTFSYGSYIIRWV